MHPRTRLVYFYFFRVNFLVKALTSGRCDQVWLPWQRCICRSRYGCFCLSPQVTYLHTKIEGGLKFFISNFASLSWRIALNNTVCSFQFQNEASCLWSERKQCQSFLTGIKHFSFKAGVSFSASTWWRAERFMKEFFKLPTTVCHANIFNS